MSDCMPDCNADPTDAELAAKLRAAAGTVEMLIERLTKRGYSVSVDIPGAALTGHLFPNRSASVEISRRITI